MTLGRKLIEVLGASKAEELTGGYQARVFLVRRGARDSFIAKVLDGVTSDARAVEALVQTVFRLAEIDAQVCRPIPLAGAWVTEVAFDRGAPGLLTCYEFADGPPLDPADAADAARMGHGLAGLHNALRRIPAIELPVVAALCDGEPTPGSAHQLLHGDFSAGNLRRGEGELIRVFAFDDCGYGPVEFEVANTLYMVLFDAVTGKDVERYRRFASPFTTAYALAAGEDLDSAVITHFIERRIRALARWIAYPSSAPPGIRNASPEWLEVLQDFVRGSRDLHAEASR